MLEMCSTLLCINTFELMNPLLCSAGMSHLPPSEFESDMDWDESNVVNPNVADILRGADSPAPPVPDGQRPVAGASTTYAKSGKPTAPGMCPPRSLVPYELSPPSTPRQSPISSPQLIGGAVGGLLCRQGSSPDPYGINSQSSSPEPYSPTCSPYSGQKQFIFPAPSAQDPDSPTSTHPDQVRYDEEFPVLPDLPVTPPYLPHPCRSHITVEYDPVKDILHAAGQGILMPAQTLQKMMVGKYQQPETGIQDHQDRLRVVEPHYALAHRQRNNKWKKQLQIEMNSADLFTIPQICKHFPMPRACDNVVKSYRPKFYGLDSPPEPRLGSDDPRVIKDPHFPRTINLGGKPCDVTIPRSPRLPAIGPPPYTYPMTIPDARMAVGPVRSTPRDRGNSSAPSTGPRTQTRPRSLLSLIIPPEVVERNRDRLAHQVPEPGFRTIRPSPRDSGARPKQFSHQSPRVVRPEPLRPVLSPEFRRPEPPRFRPFVDSRPSVHVAPQVSPVPLPEVQETHAKLGKPTTLHISSPPSSPSLSSVTPGPTLPTSPSWSSDNEPEFSIAPRVSSVTIPKVEEFHEKSEISPSPTSPSASPGNPSPSASPSVWVREERKSACMFPNCDVFARRLQDHVVRHHLPVFFRDTAHLDGNTLAYRSRALTLLAARLLGRTGVTWEEFLGYLNTHLPAIQLDSSPRQLSEMRTMCRSMALPVPEEFQEFPLNSVVVLVQWQILAQAVLLLSCNDQLKWLEDCKAPFPQAPPREPSRAPPRRKQRQPTVRSHTYSWGPGSLYGQHSQRVSLPQTPRPLVSSLGQPPITKPLVSIPFVSRIPRPLVPGLDPYQLPRPERLATPILPDLRDMLTPPSPDVDVAPPPPPYFSVGPSPVEVPMVQGAGGSDEASREPWGIQLPRAFDSHFHLDRTASACWGNSSVSTATVEAVLAHCTNEQPGIPVDLVGAVAVYCDPKWYPSSLPPHPQWRWAVGIHPKKVSLLSPAKRRQMCELIALEHVSCGEVGLDWSIPGQDRLLQEKVLQSVLCLVRTDQVLILHLRGPAKEMGVYSRGLELVKLHCPSSQPIHLHCFAGGRSEVRMWLESFPGSYFGYTGLVARFNQNQCDGLKSVPKDRLLLETDSPHLPVGELPGGVNTPRWIGDVGLAASRQLGGDALTLLTRTAENARRLYQ
jgi:TatD DNase family protein